MQKILAVVVVEMEQKALVDQQLTKISKDTKISLETLLQDDIQLQQPSLLDSWVFKTYPYITLTIPNYEMHRCYLQRVCQSSFVFSRFILLISKGDSYEELLNNKNECILREHCRSWSQLVSCKFHSAPIVVQQVQRVHKTNRILSQMDIRGKISQTGSKQKFHLIQYHIEGIVDGLIGKVPQKSFQLKLFFGFEVEGGTKITSYCQAHIKLWQEKSKHLKCTKSRQSKKLTTKKVAKLHFEQNLAFNPYLNKNPYLKKNHIEQVVISEQICPKNC